MPDGNEKTKTSINIDKQTWTEWIKFVVNKTGSTRKISEELDKTPRKAQFNFLATA
jgi:hypothetical protein